MRHSLKSHFEDPHWALPRVGQRWSSPFFLFSFMPCVPPQQAWPLPFLLDQLLLILHLSCTQCSAQHVWKTFLDHYRFWNALSPDFPQHSLLTSITTLHVSVTRLGNWTQDLCVVCTCCGLWPKQPPNPFLLSWEVTLTFHSTLLFNETKWATFVSSQAAFDETSQQWQAALIPHWANSTWQDCTCPPW